MHESARSGFVVPVLVAGVITLAVTLLRLLGELEGWAPSWFSREPGGRGALIGIVWLTPIFGFWFGRRVAAAFGRPERLRRAFAFAMLGLSSLIAGAGYIGGSLEGEELRHAMEWLGIGAAALTVFALVAWPRAFLILLAYALLARLPVVLVQFVAIDNDWGTHYEKVHPALPEMTADERAHGLMLAQLLVWVPFTILLGSVFALVGASTVRKR